MIGNNRVAEKTGIFSFFLALLLVCTVSADEEVYFSISHSSGNYSSDQLVSITPVDGSVDIQYLFLQSRSQNKVPYTVPLHLSALPGENRTYDLTVFAEKNGVVVDEKNYTFIIAKSFPGPPEVTPPPGVFHEQFEITFKKRPGRTIIYSFDAPPTKEGLEWNGLPLSFPDNRENSKKTTLFAYSVNEYGNRSSIKSWDYVLKQPAHGTEDSSFFEVLSPVEGNFANRQLLFIRHKGYEWIRYTIGGGDPTARGTGYTKPVEIDATGEITLRVAGKKTGSDSITAEEITFSVTPEAFIASSLRNGTYTEPHTVTLRNEDSTTGQIRYIVGERAVNVRDSVYSESFTLHPLRGGLKYYTVRFTAEEENALRNTEYRYFAVFDERIPVNPEIVLSEPTPLRSKTVVVIRGSAETDIYYTTDGTTPDKSSLRYEKPFELTLPENSKTGTITLRARAYTPTGAVSDQVTRLIDYDVEPPEVPLVSVTGAEIVINSSEDASIIYELASDEQEPAVPTSASPRCPDRMTLSLPRGMERTFTFRFAAIDAAGNISESSETKTVTVDTHPPPPPTVEFDSGILRMRSGGTIYYTLSENNTLPEVPDRTSETYTRPIFLFGIQDKLTVYQLNAFAVDENGNRSALSGPHTFSIDRREPSLPVMRGIKNNGLYNSEQVTIRLETVEPKLAVLYTATTDGSEPPEPDFSSPRIEESLTFPGVEGEETVIRLKLKPVYYERNRAGETKEYTFTIDLDPPRLPEPTGFENGGVYNRKVLVSIDNPDSTDTVFYSVASTQDDLTDPFSDSGKVYSKNLFFDTSYNREQTFFLRFGRVDQAGNKTLNPEIYHFTIDRLPPPPPSLGGEVDEGITFKPFEVVLSSEGNTIYYSLFEETPNFTAQGGESTAATEAVQTAYQGPFTLSGSENKEITYYVYALSVDRAGNQSQRPSIFRFTIDRKSPEYPPEPDITILDTGNNAVLSWNLVPDHSIFYRIRTQSRIDVSSFKQYTKPLQIDFADDKFSIEYYIQDQAGNKSRIETRNYRAADIPTGNYIAGLQDRKRYNEDVTIQTEVSSGIVRFEVASGGREPSPVTRFSPVLPREYVFRAAQGELAEYSLRTRVYEDDEDEIGENEQSLHFSIDKDPPPKPQITGVGPNEYYQKNCTITINAEEGTVFYRLEKHAAGTSSQEETAPSDYREYTEPIEITAEPGTYSSYSISAYAEDRAGNRSPLTPTIPFYIDREVLYVSEEYGSDYFDGSRKRPFKTVEKAVKEVQVTSRKTIFLAGEEFSIDTPLQLDFDVTIQGGFEPKNWQKTDEATTLIKPGNYFPADSPLITVADKEANIIDVGLADPNDISRNFINQRSGELILTEITLLPSSSYSHPLIRQENGALRISECRFRFDTVAVPRVISVKGNSFTMKKSTIAFNNSIDDISLVFIDRVPEAVITECSFSPGSGNRIYGIDTANSIVSVTKSIIDTGVSAVRSVGINAIDTKLSIENSEFTGNEEGRVTFCIQGEGNEIKLVNTEISAIGKRGATGLYVKDTDVDVQKCTFVTGYCDEFSYFLKLHNSSGAFFNNHFLGYHTNDFIGVEITGGIIDFINNSAVIEESDNVEIGFLVQDSPDTKIVNNIFCKRGNNRSGRKTAALVINGELPRILANNFGGWSLFARINETEFSDLAGLNLFDGKPLSGPISGNIAEPYYKTFQETKIGSFHLKESSQCVDAGIDPASLNGPLLDRDGERRPNPDHGIPPATDIGSDEYYSR
jgi:hypothetical protein